MKVPDKFDEWIEVPSHRVVLLNSKQAIQRKEARDKKRQGKSVAKKASAPQASSGALDTVSKTAPESESRSEVKKHKASAADHEKRKTLGRASDLQDSSNSEDLTTSTSRIKRKKLQKITDTGARKEDLGDAARSAQTLRDQDPSEPASDNVPRKTKQIESAPSTSLIPRRSTPTPDSREGLIPRKTKQPENPTGAGLIPKKKPKTNDLSASKILVCMSTPAEAAKVATKPVVEFRKATGNDKANISEARGANAVASRGPVGGTVGPRQAAHCNAGQRQPVGSRQGAGPRQAPPLNRGDSSMSSRWVPRQEHMSQYEARKKEEAKKREEANKKNHPLLGSRFVPKKK